MRVGNEKPGVNEPATSKDGTDVSGHKGCTYVRKKIPLAFSLMRESTLQSAGCDRGNGAIFQTHHSLLCASCHELRTLLDALVS